MVAKTLAHHNQPLSFPRTLNRLLHHQAWCMAARPCVNTSGYEVPQPSTLHITQTIMLRVLEGWLFLPPWQEVLHARHQSYNATHSPQHDKAKCHKHLSCTSGRLSRVLRHSWIFFSNRHLPTLGRCFRARASSSWLEASPTLYQPGSTYTCCAKQVHLRSSQFLMCHSHTAYNKVGEA